MTYLYRVAILLVTCTALTTATHRYAVLVGSNQASGDLQPLQYAEQDARRLSKLLVDLAGFDMDKVVLISNPDSSLIQRELDQLTARIQSDKPSQGSLFLFFYSGHADAQQLKLSKNQGYALSKIKTYLDKVPVSIKIGVFDACHSGAVTTLKGGRRGEPFYLSSQQNTQGQVIIASSAVNEKSQESPLLKSSIFTHHWLNGLRGSADFSGDRLVTVNEAYQYAFRKTIETTALTGGGVQHPVYRFNITGQGDVVLTDLSRGTGGVEIGKNCQGKFLILSQDYTDVIADFSKKPGQELYVALPAGTYTVISGMDQEVKTHTFHLLQNKSHRIEASMLQENSVMVSRIKGVQPRAERLEERPPLSKYSWGIGFGGLYRPVADDQGRHQGFSLTFANQLYVQEKMNLFVDASYVFFGQNAGVSAGLDYVDKRSGISTVAGAGAGIYYFGRKDSSLAQCLGLAGTIHGGVSLDVTKRVQMEIRIPYTIVLNRAVDQILGLELRVLVGGPYQDVRVVHE